MKLATKIKVNREKTKGKNCIPCTPDDSRKVDATNSYAISERDCIRVGTNPRLDDEMKRKTEVTTTVATIKNDTFVNDKSISPMEILISRETSN